MKIVCFTCDNTIEYHPGKPISWKVIGWLMSKSEPYLLCPDCSKTHNNLISPVLRNKTENKKPQTIKIKLPNKIQKTENLVLYREI